MREIGDSRSTCYPLKTVLSALREGPGRVSTASRSSVPLAKVVCGPGRLPAAKRGQARLGPSLFAGLAVPWGHCCLLSGFPGREGLGVASSIRLRYLRFRRGAASRSWVDRRFGDGVGRRRLGGKRGRGGLSSGAGVGVPWASLLVD